MTFSHGEVVVRDELSLNLTVDDVLEQPPFTEWLGSRLPQKRLEALLEDLLRPLESAIEPRGGYAIVRRTDTDIHTRSPPEPLLEASSLGCVVATVGEPDSGDRSMVEETVFDAMANVAVRFAKRTVVEEIIQRADELGWKTTRLFSPGSGNVEWNVEHTSFVLEHAPAESLGISVTQGGLLRPQKSVGSVLGLGPDIPGVPDPFSCVGCPRIDSCDYASLPSTRS